MRTLWYDVQLRFRNKVILFWMFLFPIICARCFRWCCGMSMRWRSRR